MEQTSTKAMTQYIWKNYISKRLQINECDRCVYIKSTSNELIIIYLNVDDMLIMDNNSKAITTTIEKTDRATNEPVQHFVNNLIFGLYLSCCNYSISINWTLYDGFVHSNFVQSLYKKEYKTSFSSPFLVIRSVAITRIDQCILGYNCEYTIGTCVRQIRLKDK